MAPLELDGNSLGEKHRHYNKLVKEAIARNTPLEADDFNTGENDVEHLMKIDIASHNKDVDYILNVLKCEDMLYVSRAINKSTWLITEQQYAHIINPNYLKEHLFPHMSASAKTKFMKHIRLHLKDEARAEQFFNHDIRSGLRVAFKWLPSCSEQFILINAKKYLNESKDIRLFKRLCEKTPLVLETVPQSVLESEKYEAANCLLHVNNEYLEAYLKLVEKIDNEYCFPRFGIRTTKLIMQKCPNRIIDNFCKYSRFVHLPTFIKFLNPYDIKNFLLTRVINKCKDAFFRGTKYIKYFIDAMPREQRAEILDQAFINKIHTHDDIKEGSKNAPIKKFYDALTSFTNEYEYYNRCEFDTAFEKITKCIRSSTSQKEKYKLLSLLVNCTGNDWNKIQTVLHYYHEKHINDPLASKKEFLKQLLPKIHISKLNLECWNKLENLFKEMELLTSINRADTETDESGCLEMIYLHKVINGEKVPEALEKLFCLKSLKPQTKNKPKKRENERCCLLLTRTEEIKPVDYKIDGLQLAQYLNEQDKEKVFHYLYNNISLKIKNLNICNETAFKKGVHYLVFLVVLLDDQKKNLLDFPWVLGRIKEYIKIKNDNSWKTNMAPIYNTRKSSMRPMFDISIALCPSQIVCLNALKHDDQLLSLENNEVNTMRCNETVSLNRLLNKLRVYWPGSHATVWTQRLMQELTTQRVNIRALCALLPRHQLQALAMRYAPKQAKINYEESDELALHVQKNLAKNMHFARPRPPPDVILLYAKGDYLQFALPSLLAIFNNANATQTRNFIPKLLSAPVSIQKHGVRLACVKLKPEEALPAFKDIWMNTKNSTIRAVVFEYTFSFLGRTRHLEKDLWETLFLFISNLTFEEDKKIYDLISERSTFDLVPNSLKAKFLRKVYDFFKALFPKLKDQRQKEHYKWKIRNLIERTTECMEHIPSDFIADYLSEFMEYKFMQKRISFRHGARCSTTKVLSAFLLCTNADKTQSKRYKFLVPYLKRCIASWDQTLDNEHFIRDNVKELLTYLTNGLKIYVFPKKMDIPLNMFKDIQRILSRLPVPENYILLTKWKLTVELTRLLKTKRLNLDWDVACLALAPEFGIKCLEFLRKDVNSYFPCIYVLFAKALNDMLKFMPDNAKYIIYECLLNDVQFVQAYLLVMKIYPCTRYNNKRDLDEAAENIRRMLGENPSVEVKMHYNHKFHVKTAD